MLALDRLLSEDSTFYGDLFPHAVKWKGVVYLEDGLHRAVRAALRNRTVLHARLLDMDVPSIEALIGEQFRGKDALIKPNFHALHLGRDWAKAELECPLGLRLEKRDKVGDRILFLPQAGLEVELDGEEFLLLRERDVQAVASSPDGKDRQPGQYL